MQGCVFQFAHLFQFFSFQFLSSTDLINNMMIHSLTHRINFSLKHLSGTSRYHLHNFLQISPTVQIKKTYLFSMVQFSMQWGYLFSENRFLSPSCASCQITLLLSSALGPLRDLYSWAWLRQSPGCWVFMGTPRNTSQLILTRWDHGAQFKKTCSRVCFS